MSGDVLLGVMNYFFISIILFAISLILVSLDGFDMVSNFTAVAATINNIGPGLEWSDQQETCRLFQFKQNCFFNYHAFWKAGNISDADTFCSDILETGKYLAN